MLTLLMILDAIVCIALIAAVLGQEIVRQVLSFSVCLIVCVYWISWFVLSRKY